MSTLPFETWTEIFSYLSLTSLLKTCSLNRPFLDLSLHFLYQEIYLSSDEPAIDQSVNRLIPDQLVADRVRRIYITSHYATLPQPRCNLFTRQVSHVRQRFNQTLARLEDLRRLLNQKYLPSSDTPQEVARADFIPNPFVLSVHELTVMASENSNVPDLVCFLKLLWEKHHVGQSLRKLEVAAISFGILLLLSPIGRYPNRISSDKGCDDKSVASRNVESSKNPLLCGLTHLSIHLIPEFNTTSSTPINKSCSRLLKPLVSTLSSFSLSYCDYPANLWTRTLYDPMSREQQDFSKVLEALPYLPALKELKIQIPFTSETMKNIGALTEWLRSYQGQLEKLAVWPMTLEFDPSKEFMEEVPGTIYSKWLFGTDHPGFLSLAFPMLHSLEIRSGFVRGTATLPMKKVAPSVRSLTMDDGFLGNQLHGIVQGLPTLQDGDCGLETLRFRTFELTPALLDILNDNLPHLKVLELICEIAMTPEDFEELSTRRYSFQLSYLRIMFVSYEGHFHPDLRIMRALVDCLESDPVLDTGLTCGCKC